MLEKRALVFVNGEQIDLAAVKRMVRPADTLVAVDGGLGHLRRLGLEPALLVGDLDSVPPKEIARCRENPAVRIMQHPVHKDETDLELALLALVQEDYTSILVLAALGGRLDMTLANISLLALPELKGVDVRLDDGIEEVFLIRPGEPGREIAGKPGDRVSLLPWGGPAEGIHTAGLYYPLRGERLYPERTRGISNLMIEDQALVTLQTGLLICIHTRIVTPLPGPGED